METIIERLKSSQQSRGGSLRRSRSVRASLRLIGNKWRSQKEGDKEKLEDRDSTLDSPEDKRKSIAVVQIWSKQKVDYDLADLGAEGKFISKTPIMPKRKHESTNHKMNYGDIDLILNPQTQKIDKPKLSDLFSSKGKYKSSKSCEIPPIVIPPKAAAILQIPTSYQQLEKKEKIVPIKNKDKMKLRIMNLKNVGKSESLNVMRPLKEQNAKNGHISRSPEEKRVRRVSEGEVSCDQSMGKGKVNPAFAFTTPPKDRRLLLSPSSYLKLQYGALLEGCAGELPSLSACAPLPPPHHDAQKMTKKQTKEQQAQLDKLAQINIHSQALFAAVEHGHLDKARNILESTDVDVNSLNSDGLSPLDVAVLVNHRQLARVLIDFGAREGTQLKTPEALGAHLRRLSREAEARLNEFTGCPGLGGRPSDDVSRSAATGAAGGAGPTGCAGGAAAERDKQAQHWERRVRALKRLALGWQQTRTPGAPQPPELEVCGAHAVSVRVRDNKQDGPIVTKYRVQWSSRADFSNVCSTRETGAGSGVRVQAAGLTRGRRYFFRAQAGNVRGWGPFSCSTPRSVVPSSWRDVDARATRWDVGSAATALESLSTAAAGARLARVPVPAPRAPRKKTATIRQLFTAASKFQKNLRRGVYLACILYHEDKVLVTNEDFLPVIEVDETYPTCIYSDFHWLMKVACAWDDVKSLRSDMEKHTSSSIHFRLKILTAIVQMQSALCIQDLGQVYHKPLRDSHGTLVLSCVSAVRSAKAASVLNSRWLPLSRLRRRLKALDEDNTIGDMLMASIHEQISYHQVSGIQLSRGLYLGYLKLQSSVEVVRIVVPAKTPNVPPHIRIRENPHVSAEEWEYLKNYHSNISSDDAISTRRMSITSIKPDKTPSESQQMFLDQITAAAKRLLKDMEIPPGNADVHRLYDLEIIELNNEVSLIMICPPAELACSVPGQKEILLQRGDLLSLPIQAFEMIHLQTYHSIILNKYSRLSCVLELDVALATHSHREAFSCAELQQAKQRLSKLEDLQNNLNAIWKAARWLMDLIGFARDKDKASVNVGIPLKNLLNRTDNESSNTDKTDSNTSIIDANLRVDFLQIPPRETIIIKSSTGRGSWPGPAGSPNNNTNLLNPEISKSEQHLSMAPRPSSVSTLNLSGSQYLSANSENYSRKNSADSQFTHSSILSNNYLGSSCQFEVKSSGSFASMANVRLPPSRSEDTLVVNQNENTDIRKRPHFLNASMSASSSPLLTVKGFYPGSMVSVRTNNTTTTTDSMHSLSSDSESQSCPLNSSTPNKSRPKSKNPRRSPCHIEPSKSMTDVKRDVDFTDTGQTDVFLKPKTYVKQTIAQSGSASSDKVSKTDENVQPRENENYAKTSSETAKISDQPGILQVYAAYDTGLASGTSLKLHVTPRTSAREVIDLVVRQLNMAAVLKGKSGPIYGPERLNEFCLVAVIGARERCLRDDFRPLQLQNPWRKGRLYVRLRHDVLAALQHSAKQPAYI